MTSILCIAGPTASGKSSRAVSEALLRGGEIISVDSRQVYRGLDIGTEKISLVERNGIPHHLIDIREPNETYSAGDFATDAARLIQEISERGKLPILAGGTHFYFNALLRGIPQTVPANPLLRSELEKQSDEELFAKTEEADPRRAKELDPKNRRRLIRALEIIQAEGTVAPRRTTATPYAVEWIVLDPTKEELVPRIESRLQKAFANGLADEVRRTRELVSDERLNEFGLEYRVVGEFLRGERTEDSLIPTLNAQLWQYARRQKAWLRKLRAEETIKEAVSLPDKN